MKNTNLADFCSALDGIHAGASWRAADAALRHLQGRYDSTATGRVRAAVMAAYKAATDKRPPRLRRACRRASRSGCSAASGRPPPARMVRLHGHRSGACSGHGGVQKPSKQTALDVRLCRPRRHAAARAGCR